jgi:hypothetical protein
MAELEEKGKQNYEAIVFFLKKYGKQNGCEYTLPYGQLRGYADGKLGGLPALLKTMKRKVCCSHINLVPFHFISI